MNKFLYFRTDDSDSATGHPARSVSNALFPAESLVTIEAASDTSIAVLFKNVRKNSIQGQTSLLDRVVLNVTQGKLQEAMRDVKNTINSAPHSNGFIVIADDQAVATTCSEHITSCGAIQLEVGNEGFGYHEYTEIVHPVAVDDNDVSNELGISIPAQAHITYASLTAIGLAGNDVGSVALEVHSASVASDAASAGTEIVGADVAGNVSLPDADLDVSSNAVIGKTITMGTLAEVQRGTDATFFHVVAKEDMKSTAITGNARVAVYIRWYGPAALDNR